MDYNYKYNNFYINSTIIYLYFQFLLDKKVYFLVQ